MNSKPTYRVIFSAGGTGGHIYPAIAVANALKQELENVDILFVGAEGKMEMEKVPKAGYKIIGLPVAGLQRRFAFSNLSFPFKLLKSLSRARKIISDFNPHVVVGFGGYASGPVLKRAQKSGIPTIVQEQNSFAGLTNKWLAKKAKKICVAYEKMDRYFPADKITITGNPVRQDILDLSKKRDLGYTQFQLDPHKKTILIIGGSLGARTINESILESLEKYKEANIQLLWQCGKFYYQSLKSRLDTALYPHVHLNEFIYQMDLAYAVADVVISRAGALSISELCVAGKASILVPSPNVSEDHQTKNAMALVEKDAAILVSDKEANEKLANEAIQLVEDEAKKNKLAIHAKEMGKPHAAKQIMEELLNAIDQNDG